MSGETLEAFFESCAVEDTLSLGAALGRALPGSLTIGLVGSLGAGKTHFVKGIAMGNAAADDGLVTSPTFTLMHEYAGRLTLYHLDAYRLKSGAELLALGFDELPHERSAVVVEWADRVRGVMPEDMMWIEFSMTGEISRSLHAVATGVTAVSCLRAWQVHPR